ncbi:LacI family DNA-binding transcriptional regulator [Nocardiopsis sp. CT-R113]|uniref:LacI family DNA-binding transcriptional regulator n=1 Tax=Nocardiopsis codii TaxID=3065942 RepID=A0ABU7KE93_9ACTN|nr:LacI family DNA-binding transcriptional regulator [Nocardiopsis sp. CT-R113]MEE2040553.1 LacI family DNA-binding transcriptional regulator [Nocardiopsis sp. CT-R113]
MSSPRKRATLRDVAARAGVSVAQASFALNGTGRVAPGTVERVRAAASDLDYQADGRARALRTGKRSAYGVVIRNMRNPFFLDVLRGMEVQAHEEGALLLIMSSDYDVAREAAALRRLTAEAVGGIAIAPIGRRGPLSAWLPNNTDIPVVAFNCTPDLSAPEGAPRVPTVGPDDGAAVTLALGHLRERGHRRATLVMAPRELAADWGREEEFLRRCAEWGIEGTVVRCPLDHASVARMAAERISAAEHDALVFNSDYLGTAVYDAARSLGLRVGRDVSVVGHDDLPTSALLDPGLTTVGLDRELLGRSVMRLLLNPQEESVRLPVTLAVRGSVAALPV